MAKNQNQKKEQETIPVTESTNNELPAYVLNEISFRTAELGVSEKELHEIDTIENLVKNSSVGIVVDIRQLPDEVFDGTKAGKNVKKFTESLKIRGMVCKAASNREKMIVKIVTPSPEPDTVDATFRDE